MCRIKSIHNNREKERNKKFLILAIMSFKQKVIDEFVLLIKQDTIKQEMKHLFKPLVEIILQDIYPYIYLSLIFVIISFLLILGNFILLVRIKLSSNI